MSASLSRISVRRGVAKSVFTLTSSSRMMPIRRSRELKDVEIIGDLGREPFQRLGDLFAAERGQARQPEFENGARLRLGEADRALGPERVTRISDERDQGRHVARRPDALHQRRRARRRNRERCG